MQFAFNEHSKLAGSHAYLSASQHSWLNYTDDHMREVYFNKLAAVRGSQMHALAEMHNKLGIPMVHNHSTINEFVNDGIGYGMSSEVLLYYSPNCYGTADLIGYNNKKKELKVFDLKTGQKDVLEFGQLHIYAALFCLEYGFNPMELKYEFRLYQNNEVRIEDNPDPNDIKDIRIKIIRFDQMLQNMSEEARVNKYIL